MLALRPLAEKTVCRGEGQVSGRHHHRLLTDLVDEDDGRLALPGRREETPHQLLPLPDILAGEAAGADVEEGPVRLAGHGPGQHGLAVAGRSEEEEAPGRSPQPGEELRPEERSSQMTAPRGRDMTIIF